MVLPIRHSGMDGGTDPLLARSAGSKIIAYLGRKSFPPAPQPRKMGFRIPSQVTPEMTWNSHHQVCLVPIASSLNTQKQPPFRVAVRQIGLYG